MASDDKTRKRYQTLFENTTFLYVYRGQQCILEYLHGYLDISIVIIIIIIICIIIIIIIIIVCIIIIIVFRFRS